MVERNELTRDAAAADAEHSKVRVRRLLLRELRRTGPGASTSWGAISRMSPTASPLKMTPWSLTAGSISGCSQGETDDAVTMPPADCEAAPQSYSQAGASARCGVSSWMREELSVRRRVQRL